MRLFKPQRHECPHCGGLLVELDDPERPGRTVKPIRGGVVVCFTCARPSVFAGTFRPEHRVEFIRHMRNAEYVRTRAEVMFRDDDEFARRWAALESLMVSP